MINKQNNTSKTILILMSIFISLFLTIVGSIAGITGVNGNDKFISEADFSVGPAFYAFIKAYFVIFILVSLIILIGLKIINRIKNFF